MTIDTVVIPAGGQGTRMAGRLGGTPKFLAPVATETFADLVLRRLVLAGIRRVHLCLGWRSRQVLRRVPEWRERYGLGISRTIEESGLGVIGGLKLAEDVLPQQFFVLYGDVYPRLPLPQAARLLMTSEFRVVVVVCHVRLAGGQSGNLGVSADRVVRYDKSSSAGLSYLDAGLLAMRRSALASLPRGIRIDESDFYPALAERGALGVVRSAWKTLHIGDPRAYQEFERFARRTLLRCL